jgi:hypothetical protein
MKRRMREILQSQRQMLIRKHASPDQMNDLALSEIYRKHIVEVETWLSQQPNITVYHSDYNELVSDPRLCLNDIRDFLRIQLDIRKMGEVIDPNLYRQREVEKPS